MIIILHKLIVIFIGSLLLGIGINGFLVPYHLIDGGIIGIALIIHYHFHFPAGLLMVILSIPLGVYTWLREPAYFYNSVFGLIISAFIIDWLAPLKNELHPPILASALLAGMFIGLGTGLMLRYKTSTGGTDLLAQFVSKALTLNLGIVIFLIDGLIVTAGLSFLGAHSFIYSCITILTVGLVSSIIVGSPTHRY